MVAGGANGEGLISQCAPLAQPLLRGGHDSGDPAYRGFSAEQKPLRCSDLPHSTASRVALSESERAANGRRTLQGGWTACRRRTRRPDAPLASFGPRPLSSLPRVGCRPVRKPAARFHVYRLAHWIERSAFTSRIS